MQIKCEGREILTNIRPLRYAGSVHLLAELWLIIIHVLEFNDELCFWLQLQTCLFVDHCGFELVKSLFLTVQAPSGVQEPFALINDKDGAGPLARENVLDRAVVRILVRLELQKDPNM